ncbi:retrotransposon hot spot (RHS) protein [Trypanosoma cruzi]|nr:retrotransposon hot spot (RHS) protein [Trypanosoma cruzi]
MTALSRAQNPIVGGMAGNFVAALWMDEESLLRVAPWVTACSACAVFVGCGLWPYPVVRGIELEAMIAVCLFSSSIGGWLLAVCAFLLCGGPNPLVRGLAALRWCVCDGWCGVAGQGEGRGGAFPATGVCSLRVFVLLLAFPLLSSPPLFLRGVAACSRAMWIVSAS